MVDMALGIVVVFSGIGVSIGSIGVALMLHELKDAIREMRLLLEQKARERTP